MALDEELLCGFIEEQNMDQVVDILSCPDPGRHLSFMLDLWMLADYSPELAMRFLTEPAETIELTRKSLLISMKRLCDEDPGMYTMKRHVHVRITSLPGAIPSVWLKSVPKSGQVGRFVGITGTVVRAGTLKSVEKEKRYECKTCGQLTAVTFQVSIGDFIKPARCQGRDMAGKLCASTNFIEIPPDRETEYYDYQEIRLQEQIDKLEMGSIPRSISVILQADLVDSCKPGETVNILGIVSHRWDPLYKDSRPQPEIVVTANYVDVSQRQGSGSQVDDSMRSQFELFWQEYATKPLAGRDNILAGFCPGIYGLYVIKLATILILIGGVQKDTAGIKVRGESHILLVGDPGTAKSQILKFASKLVPRSVLTTGIGSTSAGLTCTAVKDSGDWQLEAGALVLADGGLCCIDEFGSIREHDKTAIHEAMEQQTLSVAKAGLVCKLNTRCSVLAATNPKGNYDCNKSLEVNVALGSPLLSRFDLIFVMLDTRNDDWDRIVSTFILNNELSQTKSATHQNNQWSIDKLKNYISYCQTFNPEMTSEAQTVLTRYYQLQRKTDLPNSARTTIRLLESLIRLSQAHARLMWRNKVIIQDALMSVSLMESSMMSTNMLPVESSIHTEFPDAPDSEFADISRVILKHLNLDHLQ